MSSAGDRLRQARRRAGLVLWIEQIWPALLPVLLLLVAWALLSLLTVPQRLPGWLHGLALLLLAGVSAWLARRRVRALSSPVIAARDRRIEQRSRLAHNPLATLADRPVPAGGADALWQAHLARTETALGPLVAGSPTLSWRAHDRSGIGSGLLAGTVLAMLLSGAQAPLRLATGFLPGLALPLGPRPALQAWITPPPWAGGAPVFLSDPHGRYTVPAGSTLSISLTGSNATPRLASPPGSSPAERSGFTRLSGRSWMLQRVLPSTGADGARLQLREAGYAMADWRIVAPEAPSALVAWSSPPGADHAVPWRLSLPWRVEQLYGVQALSAEIRLADTDGTGRVLRVPIPLPGVPRKAHGVAAPDLSADPWAGAAVVARLVATDSAGHAARSADARFALPARPFRNPLARAVLDVRRRLATGREDARGAADDLAALGGTPGLLAQDDGLFLNLSAVVSLLRGSPPTPKDASDSTAEVSDRLWSLALGLEDGLHNDRAGARASAELRRTQDRLAAQIEHMRQLGAAGQNNGEQDELHRRIAALAAAIANRMRALAAEAAREHQPMPAMPDAMAQGGQTLDRMLKEMQRQTESGHAEQAMQDLSRMQAMLDGMRLATPQDLRSAAEQAAATAQARDQMQAVQDLVQRQTTLLDSTQGRQTASDQARRLAEQRLQTDGEDAAGGSAGAAPDAATRALLQQLGIPLDQAGGEQDGSDQQGSGSPAAPAPTRPGDASADNSGAGPGGPDSSGRPETPDRDAARTRDRHDQNVLARALDELGSEFTGLTGKKADSLQDAAHDMRDARDALAGGRDGDAADAQSRALAALQKGRNQMSAAMRGGRSGGTGLALLPGQGQGRNGAQDGDDDASQDQAQDDGSEDGDGGTPGQAADLGDSNGGPRDPLGRPTGEGHGLHDDGDETRLPGQDQSQHARQIEQELRRRDSDRTRPQPELDYLDRLLRQF